MPDNSGIHEKIDKAKAAKDKFINTIKQLKTPDDYRDFVISYFYNQEEKENMLNIIGLAELAQRNLNEWQAFQRLFKTVAYREFSKKVHNQFTSEEAQIGFMI
jgi:hypothetical protein